MIDKNLHQELKEYIDKQKKCYSISSDDLISDLYIYTHEKPHKLPASNKERVFYFKAWLRNQANWICLNKTNKYIFKGNDSEGLEALEIEEDASNEFEGLDHKFIQEDLLNGEYRSLYRLYYIENNTQKEVSKMLDINISIVNKCITKINVIIKHYYMGRYQIKMEL